MDNPPNAKPLEMPPLQAHGQAAVDKLTASETIKAAIEAVKRDDEKTLADQIAITEVEAPPFHEDVRAKDMVRRFEELGLKATIDEEGNVLARRAGTGNGPTLVLAAHLDTVFPAGTNPKVRKEGDRYLAPGISDDARGLAVILQVLRTLQEFKDDRLQHTPTKTIDLVSKMDSKTMQKWLDKSLKAKPKKQFSFHQMFAAGSPQVQQLTDDKLDELCNLFDDGTAGDTDELFV